MRFSSTDLHAGKYHVVGADLRVVNEVKQKLSEAEVNGELPTLFLAECVLVYVESRQTAELLQWLSTTFPTALFINYEQVILICYTSFMSFQCDTFFFLSIGMVLVVFFSLHFCIRETRLLDLEHSVP